MTDLNDKLRAALKSVFLANGSSGPKYDAALLAEAINEIIATPAPQAAPSELEIDTGLRLRLVCELLGLGNAVPEDPAELYAVAFSALGMVRHEIENLQRAAAPLTQAADPLASRAHAFATALEAAANYIDKLGGDSKNARIALVHSPSATPAAPLAQQSEPVAWAVVSSKGGVHKLAVTRESAERKAATWQKEWPNNGCTVRSLVFGDAAPHPAQQAGVQEAPSEKVKDAEPDMLWWADDGEVNADSVQEFAEEFAANSLRVGEVEDVQVFCAHRANPYKRTIRIGVVAGETEDSDRVEWKWIDAAMGDAREGGAE